MSWNKRQFLGNSWLLLALRLALGGIFIVASLSKIANGSNFANLVASYNLLPGGLAQAYGLLVPWIELAVGGLLIIGVFSRIAAAATIALVASFMVANTYSLVHGTGGSCGCFGGAMPLSHTQSLLLDGAMLLMAIPLLFSRANSRPAIIRLSLSRAFYVATLAVVVIGSRYPGVNHGLRCRQACRGSLR